MLFTCVEEKHREYDLRRNMLNDQRNDERSLRKQMKFAALCVKY